MPNILTKKISLTYPEIELHGLLNHDAHACAYAVIYVQSALFPICHPPHPPIHLLKSLGPPGVGVIP
jgi:hypothetical protein